MSIFLGKAVIIVQFKSKFTVRFRILTGKGGLKVGAENLQIFASTLDALAVPHEIGDEEFIKRCIWSVVVPFTLGSKFTF